MDEQEIKEKIKKAIKFEAESDTLEFKKSKNNLPKIYDTISSFSNTRGGLIVLGIDEKDNFKIIGVENINEIQNKISEICTQKMYPPIRPIITQIDYENKKLLVVEILELKQIEKPCYYIPNGIEKGSYIRVGDNDQKMTKYEIYALQSYKSGVNEDLKSVKRAEVKDFDEEKLSNAEILVRIFQTENDKTLTNNIAEYTNSQNAISPVDLKSISNIQIKIEEYLKQYGIMYIRKVDRSVEISEESITMEVMAQLIYSKMGYPEVVTNQKGALFNRFYDDIFNEQLDFDELITLYRSYREIEQYYSLIHKESTKQMRFYIVWLMLAKGMELKLAVSKLNEALETYRTDENISNARKIIQRPFKEHLEKLI